MTNNVSHTNTGGRVTLLDVAIIVQTGFHEMNNRMDTLESKFDSLETKVDSLESK